MIKIAIGASEKVKNSVNKKSGFVSFDYDNKILEKIKSLSTRYYISDRRCWEVPYELLSFLCNNILNEYDIEITGTYEKDTSSSEIPDSFKFKTEPYFHQLDGLKYGLANSTFLLGDDQGLGKSKVTIDIAVARKKRGEIKRCLIICGVNGLKYNWESEIAIHSDEKSWILGTRYKRDGSAKIGSTNDKLADLKNPPDCFFLITNIETLRGLHTKKKYPFADEINRLCKEGEIGMIVFDEAHKCKNPTAAQTAALIKLNANYKMALSGTFLMNSPLDLYVPLKWAGKISSSFYEYKKHYCLMGGFNHSEVIGYKNLDELREIMSQSMLRRLKTEVLDLPEKVRTVEYVEMTSKQSKIYDEIKDMLRREIDKIRLSNNPMSKLIRLRQATAWTGILSSQVQESAKMSRLVELTEEIVSKGEKCIIFSNWESVTSVIKDKLSKYNPAYITGSVDEDDRNKERDRFQKDPKCSVIIGTIGALGTGFTLTAAQTVIFMDSPWNRALKDQAEDRAHRIGTRGTVTIITLVTKDTIDEVIENIVYKKGAMSDRLIDGKMPMQVATSIVEQSLR